MEHYCTLFDQGFLPQGLALHTSLCRHAKPFTLWVLALDQSTEAALEALELPEVRVLALAGCETAELRAARANRSYGEYCWTLASYLFSFVFERDPTVHRLTYLDADVFFFGPPDVFLAELRESGRSVLITEHAFSPAYGHYASTVGQYCVQFVTFSRDPEAMTLLSHWQRQALNDSASRGTTAFGDQKYLDVWSALFPQLVHVLDHRFRTLAPWNADHAEGLSDPEPVVMYHFHSFRILNRNWSQWCVGYPLRNIGTLSRYSIYQMEVLAAIDRLRQVGSEPTVRRFRPGIGGWLRLGRSWLRGELLLHHHRTEVRG
jgi:hypothetical protein